MPERPRLTAPMADVRRAVREALVTAELSQGALVLVAVSGGSDSLALAAAVCFEAPRQSLRAQVVVIDHGLQPGSDQIAQQALRRCNEIGLEGLVRKVEVLASGDGLEAEARTARYQELDRVRAELGAELVILGHSLDDQAETVLLGLTRGSGLKSISGMSVLDAEKKLLRPLLGLEREVIRQSLIDQGIEFWDDPHNQDPRFTRVRIRELLKTIEMELGPGVNRAMARTAEIAGLAEEFLEESASQLEVSARLSSKARRQQYDAKKLEGVHPALLNQTIRLIALRVGARNLKLDQVRLVSELVTNWHGQKSITLSGITVGRENNELVFQTNKPPTSGASCS